MAQDKRRHNPARWLGRVLTEELQRLGHRRFWAVQALVLLLSVVHYAVEGLHLWPEGTPLFFLPEVLLLVPIGYAALNFGLRGSVLTALWCTLLVLPSQLLWDHGPDLPATLVQLAVLNAVAIFVGQRVDSEVRAHRQAESARLEMQASERRYRNLFEASAEAVLVCDRNGALRQANRAAAALFACPAERLVGEELTRLVGEGAARRVLAMAAAGDETELVLTNQLGNPVYLEPVGASLTGDGGEDLVQVFLRDVTRHRDWREEWRTYARFMLHGQEDERRRVARQLHDAVLQPLVAVLRHLDTLEAAVARTPSAVMGLQTARAQVEDLIDAVRDLSRRLMPPALEDLGLVASVRRFLAETATSAGIEWKLAVEGSERRFSPDVELALFRIAQEAVRNVARHALATQVRVQITFAPGQTSLQVCDNGRGFAAPPPRSELVQRGSLGLLQMQERATLLGSQLVITSAPHRGTTVSVSVTL